jgi:hypothetical protein
MRFAKVLNSDFNEPKIVQELNRYPIYSKDAGSRFVKKILITHHFKLKIQITYI